MGTNSLLVATGLHSLSTFLSLFASSSVEETRPQTLVRTSLGKGSLDVNNQSRQCFNLLLSNTQAFREGRSEWNREHTEDFRVKVFSLLRVGVLYLKPIIRSLWDPGPR